jgi:hypothetical protein
MSFRQTEKTLANLKCKLNVLRKYEVYAGVEAKKE